MNWEMKMMFCTGNLLGPAGARVLCEGLKANSTLTSLNLSCNKTICSPKDFSEGVKETYFINS